MDRPSTLVVTAVPDPEQMPAVQEYLTAVLPLLVRAGGSPVKRLQVDDVVHGRQSSMVLVMDFESSDNITGLFESPEYAALVPVRDRGFREMNILVTSAM